MTRTAFSARPSTLSARRQRGLGIVELMVGLVVALVIGLTASGIAMVFLASQRQGIGTGTTVVSTATSLDALKAHAMQAGLGFFGDTAYRCTKLNFSAGAARIADGATFSPVQVTRPTGSNFDQIDLVYATDVSGGANVFMTGSTATSATLESYLPASVNNAVLLSPATAGVPCTVRTVTSITDSTSTTPQVLNFASGGGANQAVFTTPVSYAANDRAALLGTINWYRYSVVGGNLVFTNLADNSSAILVRNVVAFRIDYGVTDGINTTTLQSWVDPIDTWATLGPNIARLRALRIGLVTQSPQRDKDVDASGVCRATTVKPVVFGESMTIGTGNDWQCYRYRVTTVVVPMQNFLAGLQ